MHRPTLNLRRFGAVSFGLGYFDGDAWVDHTTLPNRGRDLEIVGVTHPAQRDALHELLHCCEAEHDRAAARSEPVPMAVDDRARMPAGYRAGDTDVDALARHTSAR